MKVKLHSCRERGQFDVYQVHRSPFTSSYTQACHLLQLIKRNNGKRLSPGCIAHLGKYVTAAWEERPDDAKAHDTIAFLQHLLDTTGIQGTTSIDQAVHQFCQQSAAFPVACPSMTLLIAMHYIDRLKKKYQATQGTPGCSRRLILVAYILATKYIHANLSLIVRSSSAPAASLPRVHAPRAKTSISSPAPEASMVAKTPGNAHDGKESLASPPVSPRQHELTDPLQYHFFKAKKQQDTTVPLPVSPPASTSPAQFTKSTSSSPDASSSSSSASSSSTSAAPPSTSLDLAALCSHFNYRVWRMESEFVQFLDSNLHVSQPHLLLNWADTFV
ncbi:hypothetical protein BC940DRAFT_304141 [Gongronella butleri]|nr:hypothetical protein BC940DRAFT_304141 [Gongronella butleri]